MFTSITKSGSLPRGKRSRCAWKAYLKHGVSVAAGLIVGLAAEAIEAQTRNQDAAGGRVTRSAVVTAAGGPIAVDGVLDEPIWKTAPGIGALVQRQPVQGAEPSERTDVTLLYSDTHLYIGIVAHDSQPERVIGTQMARDGSIASDDRIEILLDTFRDQRSAFYFATNPSGALVDGLVANGQLNADWDAIWDVRTRRTAAGWVAEFAIPFKSLGFPAGATTWGFNVARNIHRKLEDTRWSGARLDTQFFQLSEAGEVTQLLNLSQGIGLDVRPFLAGRSLWVTGDDDDVSAEPGLDVFYNITPSLKLTATFNTDFGETEVDARQINLTRYSVLFPEKRSFFLEGAGVFNFASIGPEPAGGIPAVGADVYPFFSRQIGLLGGREVPLDAGVKLTGTVGRTDIGMLTVRTGDLDVNGARVVDPKTFFVGRVKRSLFQQSYVGVIVTNGHPERGRSGQTYGADLRLATSRWMGQPRNMVFNAFAVRSANKGVSDDDWSYGFALTYPNDKYAAQISMRTIEKNFAPALGFVQRDNVRMVRAAASYNPRPKRFLNVQQFNHDLYFTHFTRLDNGETESWDLYVTLLDWHLNSGDNLHGMFDFNPTYERLFEPFEISPGVRLLPGEYRFTRFRSNLLSTATKRRLSGSVNLTYGGYWSGHAEQVTTAVTYKLPPRFTLIVSSNQTFARLPEGRFIARIFTSNVNYAVSPRLSLTNLIQYDNRSRNLGWQSRVRWTLQPGNDLFFVFNQGWLEDDRDSRSLRFRTADTKVSAKFQYSFRF